MDDLLQLDQPVPEPAFSLNYTGLKPQAQIGKIGPLLAKMLGVEPGQLRALLGGAPLFLMRSEHRAQLESRRELLQKLGCACEIEEVECYRDWTVPVAAIRLLKELAVHGKDAAVAMLSVRPAPGIAWLQRASGAWPGCRVFALNHGQVFLHLEDVHSQGAGRQLQAIEQSLRTTLDTHLGKRKRLIASALALYPADAEAATDLLDVLMGRLTHAGKPDEIADDPAQPVQLLARPVAGRAWRKLVDQGLSDEEQKQLSPEELQTIRQHWPVGKDFMADPNPNAVRPGLARIRQQFDLGKLRRMEGCWDLIQDSESWDSIPELPDMVMQILMLTKQEDSEFSEINRLVSGDPALSSRVLTIVNSTYYGLKQRIDSLDHALVILGMDEIAELALMLGTEEVFKGPEPELGHRLWRHSATTAEITRALALRMNWPRPTGLYAAALLHDVGKILLYNSFREEMLELGRIAQQNNLPLHEMEREYFGHDHATIGALLLRRWGIPEHLCRRVELHHGPLPGDSDYSEAAALIGIADHLALRMVRGEGWADDMRLRQVQVDALKNQLGELDLKSIDQLLKDETRGLRMTPR